MSLSKITLRPMNLTRVVLRLSSGGARPLPAAAAKQLSKPSESGFFAYQRNWSRDKKYDLTKAPQKGDTPMDFLLRRLSHAYEVYPLIFLCAAWFGVFCFATYVSFDKVEIWLDRSKSDAPWAWERIRDKYYKMPTIIFDIDGRTHKRLEIMEVLQDEMLEAAKKRGTRQ